MSVAALTQASISASSSKMSPFSQIAPFRLANFVDGGNDATDIEGLVGDGAFLDLVVVEAPLAYPLSDQ
jgi:hypothetical protein